MEGFLVAVSAERWEAVSELPGDILGGDPLLGRGGGVQSEF